MILERDKAKKAKMNMSTIPIKDAKNSQTTSTKKAFSPKKLTLTITSNQPDLVQSQVKKRIYNGAKLGVAPVARAPPLFLPRPELKYIYVLHTSAPPRTYLVRATLLLSPDWRHWRLSSLPF